MCVKWNIFVFRIHTCIKWFTFFRTIVTKNDRSLNRVIIQFMKIGIFLEKKAKHIILIIIQTTLKTKRFSQKQIRWDICHFFNNFLLLTCMCCSLCCLAIPSWNLSIWLQIFIRQINVHSNLIAMNQLWIEYVNAMCDAYTTQEPIISNYLSCWWLSWDIPLWYLQVFSSLDN